jgi:PucR C-terminal helix-turn-helix domain/GGDEF-like domain
VKVAEEVGAAAAERLRARRPEIERAILNRLNVLFKPGPGPGPPYAHGLKVAVAAAVGLGIHAVAKGEENWPAIPADLIVQTRLAARENITLESLLRRYTIGYTLLSDFVICEAASIHFQEGPRVQGLMRRQAAMLDRLLAVVSEEYLREEQTLAASPEQRRVERIRRLLNYELLETADLGYDLDANHLGVIATGHDAVEMLTGLARTLDQRLLLVRRDGGTTWAWLGSVRGVDAARAEALAKKMRPHLVSIAFGEPGEGQEGWRVTHRQAKASLPVALRRPSHVARYRDVALVASILRDGLLITSFTELYLAPLAAGPGKGDVLLVTLRAYLTAERNVSSAAAALGVNRHTVTRRLQDIESRLGRPLSSCLSELDAALRLDDLGFTNPPDLISTKP